MARVWVLFQCVVLLTLGLVGGQRGLQKLADSPRIDPGIEAIQEDCRERCNKKFDSFIFTIAQLACLDQEGRSFSHGDSSKLQLQGSCVRGVKAGLPVCVRVSCVCVCVRVSPRLLPPSLSPRLV